MEEDGRQGKCVKLSQKVALTLSLHNKPLRQPPITVERSACVAMVLEIGKRNRENFASFGHALKEKKTLSILTI
eukprot:3242120-Amphidinium_carterae.1